MGARTGSEYVERLAARSPTVFIGGERLEGGIPEHPAFRNVVRTYAELYDLQRAEPDVMTYESPTSGERVGMSFAGARCSGAGRIAASARSGAPATTSTAR
jgi:4-hydroxyphenylacetate 3-monooxygenase